MRQRRTPVQHGRPLRMAGGIAFALIAAGALAACKPQPKPGTIDIVGDSITVQAYWNRDDAFAVGAPAGANIVKDAWPGFRYQDVLTTEADRVQKERPAILVIALGTNNARSLDKGWDVEDEAALAKLMDAPTKATCEVLVLPGYSDKPEVPPGDRIGMDKARAAMRAAAASRSAAGMPTVVADWGAETLADPTLTRDDGIHLADDDPADPGYRANEAAANAWTAVVWQGVAACPPLAPAS